MYIGRSLTNYETNGGLGMNESRQIGTFRLISHASGHRCGVGKIGQQKVEFEMRLRRIISGARG